MKNLVSIILPYYQKKKFIKKTLDSIYSQTFKNFEIILVYNDKNKKDLNYIKKLLIKFKKYKIIISNKIQGAGVSRNLGIKKSSGNYLAFLDCDDYWSKYKLEKQLNFMISSKVNLSHTDYFIVDDRNKIKSIRKAKDLGYKDLLKSCDIGLSTVIINKKIIKKKIEFPKIRTKEDYVLWLNLTRKGLIFKSFSKPLTYWRKTKNSLSSDVFQKLIDGYLVYYNYQGFNFFKSFIFLVRLSINFFLKKIYDRSI